MNNLINICTDFCDSDTAYRLMSFIGKIFIILKIVVPIIIIIYGTIDLLKSVINQKDNNNLKLFMKRLIYGVCFYFLVSIVTFLFSLINNKVDNKCMYIFLNPNDVNINKIDITSINSENACKKLGIPYIWKDNQCQIDVSQDRVGG